MSRAVECVASAVQVDTCAPDVVAQSDGERSRLVTPTRERDRGWLRTMMAGPSWPAAAEEPAGGLWPPISRERLIPSHATDPTQPGVSSARLPEGDAPVVRS